MLAILPRWTEKSKGIHDGRLVGTICSDPDVNSDTKMLSHRSYLELIHGDLSFERKGNVSARHWALQGKGKRGMRSLTRLYPVPSYLEHGALTVVSFRKQYYRVPATRSSVNDGKRQRP
jgi:hypothetical protein